MGICQVWRWGKSISFLLLYKYICISSWLHIFSRIFKLWLSGVWHLKQIVILILYSEPFSQESFIFSWRYIWLLAEVNIYWKFCLCFGSENTPSLWISRPYIILISRKVFQTSQHSASWLYLLYVDITKLSLIRLFNSA